MNSMNNIIDLNKIELTDIEMFFDWLQGGECTENVNFAATPNLTADEAFSVIYYLQEVLDFLLSQIMDSEIKCRWLEDMTDDEKVTHPEAAVTGSYLKKSQFSNTECCATWWSKLSKNEKSIIMSIPNFDKYIFKEITGIDIDKD